MKRIGTVVISILMIISLSACAIYTEEDLDNARQSGYDEGYEVGYDEGYDIGHDEGYSEAEYDNGENDLSGYLGPSPSTSSTFLTTDTAPAGTVWSAASQRLLQINLCQPVSDSCQRRCT